MYVPVQPFSPFGVAPANLTYDLTRINFNGIKLGKQPFCTGNTGCLVQPQDGTVMATSALDMTHAICQGEVKTMGTTRYTGICQRQIVQHSHDIADSFLTECKSNRNDFIVVTYKKHSTNFTASGNALALINKIPLVALSNYKKSQTVDEANADIYMYCPTSFPGSSVHNE